MAGAHGGRGMGARRCAGLKGMGKAGLLGALSHDTSFAETAVEKLLALNGKVINVTCRMGEKQLEDPATQSNEWEVNQKLCALADLISFGHPR